VWAEDVAGPRVDARQENQQNRIQEGVASGQLTAPETRRLERQQRRITRAERRREADGTLSARDKAALERKQDRASRHINRTKHNTRTSAP
jgi:hypothetical protein